MDTNTWATIAALFGCAIAVIQMQRKSTAELRAEINDVRTEVNGVRTEVNGVRTELGARIDGLDRKFDAKLDALDQKFDTKFDTLSGQVYDLNTRVTAALGLPRAADG